MELPLRIPALLPSFEWEVCSTDRTILACVTPEPIADRICQKKLCQRIPIETFHFLKKVPESFTKKVFEIFKNNLGLILP